MIDDANPSRYTALARWNNDMRPSSYTEVLAEEIAARIAEGEILTAICRGEGMPHVRTVLRWLDKHDGFRGLYDRAREVRADIWGDELIEISDDTSKDWVDKSKPDGSTERVLDHEHVTRSKLRVDARKWLMSKAAPRKYGDKLDLNHSGVVDVDRPDFSGLSRDERAVIKELALKAKAAVEARRRAEATDR